SAGIYLPAGARGPAFLVFSNFSVILKYNNAASYALGVALLADQARGAPPVIAAWPRGEAVLSREQRFDFQNLLNTLGFDPGAIDGVLGHKTRAALRLYQKSRGLPADGWATLEMLYRMKEDVHP
ncbi:MAG TPA: peptidoglycan-binding protein, partial [Rhizomicrobium sp.]